MCRFSGVPSSSYRILGLSQPSVTALLFQSQTWVICSFAVAECVGTTMVFCAGPPSHPESPRLTRHDSERPSSARMWNSNPLLRSLMCVPALHSNRHQLTFGISVKCELWGCWVWCVAISNSQTVLFIGLDYLSLQRAAAQRGLCLSWGLWVFSIKFVSYWHCFASSRSPLVVLPLLLSLY